MDNFCIGAAQFGMDYGIANKKGKPTLSEIFNIVETALSNNIFYVDTAQAYGDSETVLGHAIKHFNAGNEIKCVTKLLPDFEFQDINQLKDCVRNSIKNLNVKKLYALLLHRPNIKGNWDDFLNGINQLKNEGLIDKFGVSIYSPNDAVKFGENGQIDVIQVPFNVLDRRLIDRDFFSIARKNKKEVFIRSIYLQGLLLMNHDNINLKNMGWSLPFILKFTDFINIHKLNLKEFIIEAIQLKAPVAKLIFGIESNSQLVENIALMQSTNYYQSEINEWWDTMPLFPDKLLNPALWSSNE